MKEEFKQETYTLLDCYKDFKKSKPTSITLKQYRDICHDFNLMFSEAVVQGKVMTLPFGLGSFWIMKKKTDCERLLIDFNQTKLSGKTVFHTNDHSDGWWGHWKWGKTTSRVANIRFYSFVATRKNKREISKVMKEKDGHKKYFS
jgi:hypothetical protein